MHKGLQSGERLLRQDGSTEEGAGDATALPPPRPPVLVGVQVEAPAVHVLHPHHLYAALAVAGANGHGDVLTLWIHHTTIGIAKSCFEIAGSRFSRILTQRQPEQIVVNTSSPSEAVLAALIGKIAAYEPDLVDVIHAFATHDRSKLYCVGERAFVACTLLSEVALPNAITYIGSLAFAGCIRLQTVTLPDTLTHIGANAFRECTGLTGLTLPNTITDIGSLAFAGCSRLRALTLPNTLTHIGMGMFFQCSALMEVTLPDTLTHIGDEAFRRCTGLTEVTLPRTLTHIGNMAFYGCIGLTEVILPNALTHVGRMAFCGCDKLTKVTLLNKRTHTHFGHNAIPEHTTLAVAILPSVCPFIDATC